SSPWSAGASSPPLSPEVRPAAGAAAEPQPTGAPSPVSGRPADSGPGVFGRPAGAGTGSDEVGVRAHLGDLGLIGHDRGSPGRVEMHHPQVGDAFALATRDPSPFVRIRGVRQILVLAELLGDGGLEVF